MKLFATVIVCVLFAGVSEGQSFGYASFAGATGLSLNGAAQVDPVTGNLLVTPNATAQSGRAWTTTPVYVGFGFDTVFQFQVTRTGTGADGMAFIVQNSVSGNAAAPIGGTGSDNGYGGTPGIANALAIELDMYQMSSAPYNDTSGNEISVHTMGAAAINAWESSSVGRVTPPIPMNDQSVHTLRVNYVPGGSPSGSPGTLSIYLDNMVVPVLVAAYDFGTGGTYVNSGTPAPGLSLPNGTAYVGFSAATGGLSQSHEVLNWTFASTNAPVTCQTGNVGAGSLISPEQVLKVNGSSGGLQHSVNATVNSSLVVSFDAFPLGAVQPFIIWGMIGPSAALIPLTTPYGDLCFIPQFLDPFNPFSFTLTDCIGLGISGFLPSVPGSWSVTLPSGISIPLTLTLQGALIDMGMPLIMNAVTLNIIPAPAPTISTVAPPYASVGATVTITGTNFSNVASVTFGGVPGAITTQSATQIVTTVPVGVPCPAPLVVTNPDGQFATRNFNAPAINTVTPGSGAAAGGTTLFLLGSGFPAGCSVTIGGTPAVVISNTPIQIVCTTPPHASGPNAVVITTPQGCTASGTFTYL